MGHSQAGYVIPIAAQLERPAFAVIANGGGIDAGAQSLFDKENDLRRAGHEPEAIEEALSLLARVQAYARRENVDYDALNRDFVAAQHESWFDVLDLPRLPAFPSWENPPEALIEFSEELQFDPDAVQRKIDFPILVLLGADDETVPAGVVEESWRRTLAAAPTETYEIRIVEGLGHGMREPAGDDGQSRLSPVYLSAIRSWLENSVITARSAFD